MAARVAEHLAHRLAGLLGLAGGEALKPGLYFPDSIIEPAYYLARMKEFGAVFTERNANG